jgi:hypothetical protein
MKKLAIPYISCLLVFALLLGSFGTAKAEVGDDPVVTPVSGDMEFATEVVPIASLPGTIELADLMLAPAGFPEGEAQFEGAGVLVTKFDAGKANACFTISGTQWGWGGKVGMWNGSKWVMLPTTIKTTGNDGTSTTACATITGNGTYAFIKYVTEPDKLPVRKPSCLQIGAPINLSINGFSAPGGTFFTNLSGLISPNENSWATYQIINYSEGVYGDLYGNVTTNVLSRFDFTPDQWYVPDGGSFTIHLETPSCYFDWTFNEPA